ncbi:MAG: hypothetical protein Q9201_000642, partial [Fulgogasparrea decipioides]
MTHRLQPTTSTPPPSLPSSSSSSPPSTNACASTKPASTTRIRDNQRRSRARRKEYILELENKVRAYEQRGVEAASEIQTAARRVVE